MTVREKHINKMEVVKEELQICIKGTPHYNDVYKYYRKLADELELYDRLVGESK
ncbi:MAG: hypothetical protein M0R51_08965 [Clostridia bacterium]|nr:hypothetical protein [Clostridia bacterium]